MKEFNELINIIERLLAPDGCPWDREQTLQTMRRSIVEETYEVIEAIDIGDNRQIEEELGDLLLNVIFISKLAEKEGRFSLKDILKHIVAKLIRRHPHIFGEVSIKTSEEVLKQWDSIKESERKELARHSILDGIPKDLPSLAKAQKMAQRISNKEFLAKEKSQPLTNEDKAGEALWASVKEMEKQGIQAEQALRKRLAEIEAEFRAWESQSST